MGINVSGLALDIGKMLARKDQVVKQNNDGILYLFKKNKIAFFHGRGSFVKGGDAGYEIKVAGAAEETIVGQADRHCTGSNARALPGRGLRRGQHPLERRSSAHRRRCPRSSR
jgi:dihydrolipoamide dehydrogenase